MKIASSNRHGLILKALQAARYLNVASLARQFDVSEMTIRRDLDRLAALGKLERTHGGASALDAGKQPKLDIIEPSITDRASSFGVQKAVIARTAARLVSPGQTVALDIGSTVASLAAEMREMRVSIYTTSVRIAAQMSDARAMVYVPGGLIAGNEPSIVGARAVDHLNQLNFDIAFLGASGVSSNGWFYDYSIEDTEIKRALTENADKVVMLLDSSKFNRISVARICDGSKIDILITDKEPQNEIRSQLKKCGTEIVVG